MLVRVSLVFFVLMIWLNSHDVWGWSSRLKINHHGKLAEKVRERLELPNPSLKRC